MSVDVEEYFHVSVFDGIVPRHRWDTLEARVELTDLVFALDGGEWQAAYDATLGKSGSTTDKPVLERY